MYVKVDVHANLNHQAPRLTAPVAALLHKNISGLVIFLQEFERLDAMVHPFLLRPSHCAGGKRMPRIRWKVPNPRLLCPGTGAARVA